MSSEFIVAPVTADAPMAMQLMGKVEQALVSIPEASVVGRIADRILVIQASAAAVARLREVFGTQIRIEKNQDLHF